MGSKQKPYQIWQAGISLAAWPLANSSRPSPAMEYGGSAARPLSHSASYAGYHTRARSPSSRENDGTEREALSVGRDMLCTRKLFLEEGKSRFSGGSLFSETYACSLAWFLVTLCFSFKHQTEVGMHADFYEDRLPLEQRLPLVYNTFRGHDIS